MKRVSHRSDATKKRAFNAKLFVLILMITMLVGNLGTVGINIQSTYAVEMMDTNIQSTYADSGEVYDTAFFESKFDTIYEINVATVTNGTSYPGYSVTSTAIIFNNATINYDPDIAYKITGTTTARPLVVSSNPLEAGATINLILNGVSITNGVQAPLVLSATNANASLWLVDETQNTFATTNPTYNGVAPAGISVQTGRTLNIYGSDCDDRSKVGKLSAKAADRAANTTGNSGGLGGAAGIGGDGPIINTGTAAPSCGTVNIYGGNITASGGKGSITTSVANQDFHGHGGDGAGIGGAGGSGASTSTQTGMRGGDGGIVTITNKAIVTAEGVGYCAGIGGGGGGGPSGKWNGSTWNMNSNPSGGGGGTIRIQGEANVTAFGLTGIGGGSTNLGDQLLGTAAEVYIDNTATVRAYTSNRSYPAIHAINNENKSLIPAYVVSGCFYSAFTGSNPKIRVYNLENGVTSPPETPADEPRMVLSFPANKYTISFAFTAPDQDRAHDYICIADQNNTSSHVVWRNSKGQETRPASGDSLYSTNAQYDITSKLSLAKRDFWLLQKNVVSFSLNYTGAPTPPASQSLYQGEKVMEPSPPTRTNYIFMGWYKSSGNNVTSTDPSVGRWSFDTDTVGTANMTLYAGWLAERTVTFVPNGGTFEDGSTTNFLKKVANGQMVESPGITRVGYVFGGWYSNATLTTLFNFSTTITSNQTLYAKWLDACTVTFDLAGGNPPNPENQTVLLGEKIIEPPIPTREGYIFEGWFKTGVDRKWDFNKNITAIDTDNLAVPYSLKLTAKWKKLAVNLYVRQIVVGEKSSLALSKVGYLSLANNGKNYGMVMESGSDDTEMNNYTVYKLAREDLPFMINIILPSYYKLNDLGYKISITAAENPSSSYRIGTLDLDSAEFASTDDIYITVYITPVISKVSDPNGWFEKPYNWDYRSKFLGTVQ